LAVRKKNIVLFILAIIIIAGAIGFYLYNKGPVNVRSAGATKADAVTLYKAFIKDSVQAKQSYTNKILEVSGIVARVSKNKQNQVIVMLQTNEAGAYINCTLEEEAVSPEENKQAVLKGICTGMGMSDPDLGILGDVYLTRCYITK
jgi:tRNA_anti-like